MGLVKGHEHLTVIDPVLESRRTRTVPGMAHFAGTGPVGKTCRECLHWTGRGNESGYYAAGGKFGGVLRNRSCEKYRSMMHDTVGPTVPYSAAACKYFEANKTPPAIAQRR